MTSSPEDYDAVVADIEARIRGLETRVNEHEIALAAPGLAPTQPTSDGPAFATLEAWVAEHFTQVYVRPLGGQWRWCAKWWDHAEAISRLEALWRSWEVLRLDPGVGMATWYSQYLDPQLPVLLGERGPFTRCVENRHEISRPLPTNSAPAGWLKKY